MGTLLRWLEDDILHSVDLPRKKPPFSRMNVVGINQDHKDLDFKGILFLSFRQCVCVWFSSTQTHSKSNAAPIHAYRLRLLALNVHTPSENVSVPYFGWVN